MTFGAWCERHRAQVLLFDADVLTVRNTDVGVLVQWRCPCGYRGSTLTGRGAGCRVL